MSYWEYVLGGRGGHLNACPGGLEGVIEACSGGIYKTVPGGRGIIYDCPGGGGGGGGGVHLQLLSSVGVYG